MSKNSIRAIEMQALDVSKLVGATFAHLGILTEACFDVRIINNSDIPLVISYDGNTEHDYVLDGQVGRITGVPYATNMMSNMAKGTVVHIANDSGGAGTGYVYLVGYYQDKG